MTNIYHQADAKPTLLAQRKIAVLGYGNQGRAQAQNLRDSGADVIIGNIDDDYKQQALDDGMPVFSIAEASQQADTLMVLLPDEIIPEVFLRDIKENLNPGDVLSFASGYTVTYKLIDWPDFVDVVLLGPRMIGWGVRDLYKKDEGFFSFVAVENDASGQAKDVLLSLAGGIGTLKKGAVEVTFAIETELDLFNEQAFGPAFGRVLLDSINTLIEAGYPKEAVLLEFYMSGELSYICQAMSQTGLIHQLDAHSQTSQYGAISRGIHFLGMNLKRPMKNILRSIRNGKFAREWGFEQRTGKWRYRILKAFALKQPINKLEQDVRRDLGMSA